MKYVIITPVKDEESFIQKTIESMINQTVIPEEWILVNDRSVDRTVEIIEAYIKDYPWIRILNYDNSTLDRKPGNNVVNAFMYGYNNLKNQDYDLLCKLDGDLEFGKHFFSNFIQNFITNIDLGIASGKIVEKNTGKETKNHHPELTVGANKVYRKECFEKILPLFPYKGWDFLDNIKAHQYDYQTRILPIYGLHLKPMDSAVGYRNEEYEKGYSDARMSFSLVFVLIKAIKKMFFEKPYVLRAAMYINGFVKNYFIDKNIIDDTELIFIIREFHFRRIKQLLKLK